MTTTRPVKFMSARFLVTGVVLVLAAVGIRPGLAALTEALSKESIDLREELAGFPQEDLPSYRFLRDTSDADWLSDFEELGTHEVLSYTYESKTLPQPREFISFVTYYSNPHETIPHTPDVCYRAGGATIRGMRTTTIETPELAPEIERIDARVLDIQLDRNRLTLVYILCVNGKIVADRESARLRMGLSLDDYVYFSKLEVLHMRDNDADFESTVAPCERLLVEKLAVLMRDHYPRREDLRRK